MYVKLFGSILKSSVWDESPATRLTWITMLLMADEDGFVQGVPTGIARQANVPAEECARALEVLAAPDPASQTPDHEGRRIERVDGGWMVLNYTKYREMRTRDQVKAANKKRRQRAKKEQVTTPTEGDMSPLSPSVPTIASASVSDVVVEVSRARAVEPDGLAACFAVPAHRDAYLAYRRAHRMPDGMDASLTALNAGMHGPAVPWEALGAALVDMRGASADFSPKAVAGFARRVGESPPANGSNRQDRNLAAITEGLRRYGNGES